MKIIKPLLVVVAVSLAFTACKKTDHVRSFSLGSYTDTAGTLKSASAIPIGFAIEYNLAKTDPKYLATISKEGSSVTFGYHMKHGAIVRDDGSFNYAATDELFNLATNAGLTVFGHTLGWHQNQNANYLKTLVSGTTGPAATNIIKNGDFELGSGTNFTNWSVYNTNGATFTEGTAGGEVRGGSRSLKIVNPNNNPGNQWRVQIASDLMNTTVNTPYRVTFWIRALAGGGSGRLSTQPTAQYQGDFTPGTDWTQVSWTFTARDAQTRILFDMGAAANTYLIDDVTVVDATVVAPPTGAEVAAAVDTALSRFIRNTVSRYAGKVKAWDVLNEAMADGSSGLRNSSNTPAPAGATDYFLWSQYLGRDYGLKAFNYAKAADPAALLFINDYNLESNAAKLDSLIKYVQELKAKGAKIDGIGTQMHININTAHSGIETMFKKLAATGLLVRISELDVRMNLSDVANFKPTPTMLAYQAAMYQYVVDTYVTYVPAAQRHGITIWGVTDADSWINTVQKKADNPLLFNADYTKKPAYSAVLQSLRKAAQ